MIDLEEVKKMVDDHLPGIAKRHPGVKMLVAFVGKTVGAINKLDERLKKVEAALRDKTDKQE